MKQKYIKTKIILICTFIILFFPTWIMIIGSFQNIQGFMKMPPDLWPTFFTIKNYTIMLYMPIFTWLKNTLIILISTVFLSVFISTSCGYVFATTKFKGKEFIWGILLIGLLLPRISVLIPIYVIIRQLGLSGTLLAVILSTSFSSFGILMARNYFENIPKSLFESAILDGADDVQIIWYIVMPVSFPAITTLSLSTAIFSLSDYIWQALVLQKQAMQTLMVGLIKSGTIGQMIGGEAAINPLGKMMAVGVILFIPLLCVFLISNKYYLSSRGGAIKE